VGVLRCSPSSEEGARCLETPEWMFDRVVCCGMVRGDSPRVSRAALYSLRPGILGRLRRNSQLVSLDQGFVRATRIITPFFLGGSIS
jgi:hypothetical protein